MRANYDPSSASPHATHRAARLFDEISYAVRNTNSSALCACGIGILPAFGRAVGRRCSNLMEMATLLTRFVGTETSSLIHAHRQGVADQHIAALQAKAGTSIREKTATGTKFIGDLIANPREMAPHVILGALSFYLGSGGLDGDGGVPDQDLALGLGAHRSILTHSILSGAVIEALAISALDLIRSVHVNLPPNHDRLWDNIVQGGGSFAEIFTRYVSLGISYHLAVDATIDGSGLYKDLPVALPAEGHQVVAAVNAAAEGADACKSTIRMGQTARPSPWKRYPTHSEASAAARHYAGYRVEFEDEARGHKLIRSF